MTTRVLTFAEIEAVDLCTRAGWLPMETGPRGDPKRAVDYVLQLAERIKNERASMTLDLAANAAR